MLYVPRAVAQSGAWSASATAASASSTPRSSSACPSAARLSVRSHSSSGIDNRAAKAAPKRMPSASSVAATTTCRGRPQKRFATKRLPRTGSEPIAITSGVHRSSARPSFGSVVAASTSGCFGAANSTSCSASRVGGVPSAISNGVCPPTRWSAATGAATAAVQGSSSETTRKSNFAGAAGAAPAARTAKTPATRPIQPAAARRFDLP